MKFGRREFLGRAAQVAAASFDCNGAAEHRVQIVPPGRRLRINALTRRGGSILVEVAGPDGKPLPGRSFAEARRVIGDQHWAPLIWDGGQDLGFAENSSILLRFRMDQAQIYGLEFA